jgi:hypothetical protein
MKLACLVLLVILLSFELLAQPSSYYPIKLKLNNTPPSKKEGLSNISIGFGLVKAIRYRDDELNRNHDLRFLVNLNMTAKIHHPFYLSMGFEYNKKDVDGYFDTYNISALPSLAGTAFNKKISYFTEIGPNVLTIFWRNKSISFILGLTIALKAQYNITEKYSLGVNVRHINYFNVWSEHYFIIHSHIYFAMKI